MAIFSKPLKQELNLKMIPSEVTLNFTSPDPYLIKYVHDGVLMSLANYTNNMNNPRAKQEDEEPTQTRVMGFVHQEDEEEE